MSDTDPGVPVKPTDPGVAMNPQISALSGLASKQPLLALVAVFVMAGGGGTVGSMYVAPLVDDALAKHEADERAHQIDRLEDRLDRLEGKIDEQGRGLVELRAGGETAGKILEGT